MAFSRLLSACTKVCSEAQQQFSWTEASPALGPAEVPRCARLSNQAQPQRYKPWVTPAQQHPGGALLDQYQALKQANGAMPRLPLLLCTFSVLSSVLRRVCLPEPLQLLGGSPSRVGMVFWFKWLWENKLLYESKQTNWHSHFISTTWFLRWLNPWRTEFMPILGILFYLLLPHQLIWWQLKKFSAFRYVEPLKHTQTQTCRIILTV